ncbi:hypothetical protein K504DRAFT_537480 [Pleomassaria siparia CBS 279.74]|uniref:Aminoglycoside phosphotransferase domain-containing protein n=1 Tax=Pleomassaria siparia CBS 279.74 TaxID=1314801 RepID=A0A6G1JWB0_9PLEO|nr:hypothetical protein K504DRAFT_537480 [Pleomassaria siparia CBS 279.74]
MSFVVKRRDLRHLTKETIEEHAAKGITMDALTLHRSGGHRIVLTHGDLNQANIMVKHGKIVSLIDWEFSGWYPEYWEYVNFCMHIRPTHKGWMNYAKDIFSDTFDDDLVFTIALLHCL